MQKRDWWNYFRLNANYAYGRFNTLNENSETLVDWYQTTTVGSRHTFNVGASFSVGLGDLFNRRIKLKKYKYDIEQLQYTQDEVMEERRLRVLEAYNAVTEQLATIKAKAETAALYNAQMKISEYNFIQGKNGHYFIIYGTCTSYWCCHSLRTSPSYATQLNHFIRNVD